MKLATQVHYAGDIRAAARDIAAMLHRASLHSS
jgi:hypothetical protein